MLKKAITALLSLTLLLALFTPKTVLADEVAGSSAKLSYEQNSLVKNVDNVDIQVKKAVIRDLLQSKKSILADEADFFVDSCVKYDIDCYLLPSIAGLESSFGAHTYPGSHNPFGWGGGMIIFPSWADAFDSVASGLRNRYINRGAETIEEIGPIYAASPTWAVRVRSFHNQFLKLEEEKKDIYVRISMEMSK